jgi:predicted metal-dependent HD superfamily phosphohydrolase
MHIPAFFDEHFSRLGWDRNLRCFVIAAYTTPGRHYHGLGHIARMVRDIMSPGRPKVVSTFERELLAATFFHDIVYDVRAADNEEQSVVTGKLWLDAERHDLNLELVWELILATKEHDVNNIMPQYKRFFLMSDLSILWAEPHIYSWYAHGIRKEYGFVPAEAYREGRAGVIKRLGNHLPPIHAKLMNRANRNIAWELERIEQGDFDVP